MSVPTYFACFVCVCLQEVSALKCDQLLSSGQVLPSECVSGLVELAGNPNTSLTLTSSIISLLAQLGRVRLCTYMLIRAAQHIVLASIVTL